MDAGLELRWLKSESAEGAVQRFAKFCKKDVIKQAKEDDFDMEKYQEAVTLVMQKLDKKEAVKEIFNAD